MMIDEALEVLGLERPTRPRNKIECPKHEERTPSLHLYQRDFYCYSCGANGDAYGLIALIQDRPIGDVLWEYGDKHSNFKPKVAATNYQLRKELERQWLDYENEYLDALYEVVDDLPRAQQTERITRIYEMVDAVQYDTRDMHVEELRQALRSSVLWLDDKLKQQIELRNVFRGGGVDHVQLPRTELRHEVLQVGRPGRGGVRVRRTPRQLGSVRVETA